MEAEVQVSAETGTGAAPDMDAVLTGASAESLPLDGGEPETPESAEATPEVKEPESTEAAETKPDQTAEEFAEPLPQKIEDLLKAVKQANPKLGTELNRLVREDHFALNGPEGYRAVMPTVQEAREYKQIAPTVEDLRTMADYSQRYDMLDQQYTRDPVGLLQTLAQDQELFPGIVKAFEPALRATPQMYEAAAKPFNQNFWQNVMATVQREGTEEEQQLFKAFEQKYLGQMGVGQGQAQYRNTPESQELDRLRAERSAFESQRRESFFMDVKQESSKAFSDEVKKYMAEKLGKVNEDDLDDATREATARVWDFVNSNEIVRGRLARVIDGGDMSPQHRKAALDAVMAYAKARMQEESAPVIRKWLNRMRAYQGGNGNATKQTVTRASKDVGSGSPTAGAPATGTAPKGAPQGWNLMDADAKAKFVNWAAMGPDAEEIFMKALQTKDFSQVIVKGK